jgi:succinoglycan biosynthesis transport protein ExoP
MTTVTQIRPVAPAHARPSAAPPGPAAGIGLPQIDPFKLFQRHWKKGIVAAILGGMLGAGIHFAWMATYPIYSAEAIFQCAAAPEADNIISGDQVDTDEIERFMATQASIMGSQRVLERATKDPAFQTVARNWCKPYIRGGIFSSSEAATDLQETISARVIADTYLISLSLNWKNKEEVAGIVGIVRKAYLNDLNASGNAEATDVRGAYKSTIDDLDRQLLNLQTKRDNMLREAGPDSLDVKEASARSLLNDINTSLLGVDSSYRAAVVQLQQLTAGVQGGGTPTYPDDFRQQIEMDGQIMRIKATIDSLNASLLSLQEQGIGTESRAHKSLLAQIAGHTTTLNATREALLRERYDATVESLQKGIQQLAAQGQELGKQAAQARERLNVLTILQTNLIDITNQITKATTDKAEYQSRTALEDARRKRASADRVSVVQSEQVPQFVTFPKLIILIPAGILLVSGAFAGFLVLGELLDQRVKGPGDIALIPRARLLGMVPHGAEDPSNPENVETSFVDQPRGAVAESFRQLRAVISERMAHGRHKSLLVASGMPGSGGSSVVSNLAMAAAAGDQRVLIIDANFRRPAQHKFFKLGDAPGLAEVLSGTHSLDQAIQATSSENLSVLTCGSSGARQLERLGTDKMTSIIRDASAKFDLVLIDVAPAIVSGDASALSSRTDAAMLVVMALNEKRGMVNRLKNELSEGRAEFIGILVNGVRSSAGGYLRRNIRATHEYQNGQA